ncbi:MAG TPA: ABC transporter permease, partial [Thermoanaerobaculia bacterium]|nr:ABC transporter permease [Thermoanaerobaculia bacterium]
MARFLPQDFLYALRTLRRSPGFFAAATLLLGLGLGANAAIFSVVRSVLLRPPPFPDSGRLVLLRARHRPNEMGTEVAIPTFLEWRRDSRSLAQIGAFGPASFNWSGREAPERLEAAQLTPGALAALGVRPSLGRLFLPDEEGPDSRVALVSFGFWKSRLAGDPAVLGRVLRLSGFDYPIVGVLPADFDFPMRDVQVWVPLRLTAGRIRDRQSRWVYAVGRLNNGVSLAAAQQEMDAVTAAQSRRDPEALANWGVRIVPLQEDIVGAVRPALLILQAAVLVILLIACANLANLQMARAVARRTETAVRLAIGASPWDLARPLLWEGAILAAGGSALGLLAARGGLPLLVRLAPDRIPRLDGIAVDGIVVALALGLAAATALVLGLLPAVSVRAATLAGDLREAGRGGAGGRFARFRRSATIFQVATSMVLVIGAGLLLRSLERLRRVDPGFGPQGVLTMETVLSPARFSDPAKAALFFRELVDRASRLPDVLAAGGVSSLPLSGSNQTEGYRIEGRPQPEPGAVPEAAYRGATPGYFRTMQIPLLGGR